MLACKQGRPAICRVRVARNLGLNGTLNRKITNLDLYQVGKLRCICQSLNLVGVKDYQPTFFLQRICNNFVRGGQIVIVSGYT